MKITKFLHWFAMLLCLMSVFALSGCVVLPFYSCFDYPVFWNGCIYNTYDEYSFNEELGNYAMCGFYDDGLGIGFKIYTNDYSAYRWGQITMNGEELPALFHTYYDGETYIYLSADSRLEAFNIEAAVVILAFEGGDIVCKEVIYDNFNLNLDGMRLKCRSLDGSDYLPHESSFTDFFSDETHILSVWRGYSTMYYSGRARTLVDGRIKTYNVKLVFLEDGVFEIYDSDAAELVSQGTYKIIDKNTATLQFGQNDNLYAEKPFASYPCMTISGTYYSGGY